MFGAGVKRREIVFTQIEWGNTDFSSPHPLLIAVEGFGCRSNAVVSLAVQTSSGNKHQTVQ